MLIKCDSDATAFILHCTFTSIFCLRHECRGLKSGILLILALSDWMAVLCQTLTSLAREKTMWLATVCICDQPQVLLQTGVFILNLAVLTVNTDLSEASLLTKRPSYLHLFLFNAVSFTLTTTVSRTLEHTFDDIGDTLAADHVIGVTFFMSIYRTIFLSLDCLYYAYTNPEDTKRFSVVDNLRLGGNAIIIEI